DAGLDFDVFFPAPAALLLTAGVPCRHRFSSPALASSGAVVELSGDLTLPAACDRIGSFPAGSAGQLPSGKFCT
ncbi:MAG: hypothetical protein ACR2JG_06305, partial [Geodermatophilaceae bacterium]